jgi:hypothetical protein
MADRHPSWYNTELERSIAAILEHSGYEYEYEPRIGGLRPDFVATAPNGAMVVIEAKGWSGDREHLERAQRQAEAYKTATAVEAALVVLAEAPPADAPGGVIGLHHLASWLQYFGHVLDEDEEEEGLDSTREGVEYTIRSESPYTVFAAMPFSAQYDDVYLVAMSYAAEQVGAACVRVDHEEFSGDIVSEIRRLIASSVAVIADLSEAKPNVLYEVGYAHALRRPTVHICSTPMSDLPFDVSHDNTLAYTPGQTYALRERLAKRLRAVLDVPST